MLVDAEIAHGDHFERRGAAALQRWRRAGPTEHQLVERAEMILRAADGQGSREIAAALGTRPARVSKWRTRFERVEPVGPIHPVGMRRRDHGERVRQVPAPDVRRSMEALYTLGSNYPDSRTNSRIIRAFHDPA